MDLNGISQVLIKVAGISIIIFTLVGVPTYISYYFSLNLDNDSVGTFLLISVLPMALPILVGFLLWKFPGTIANKIVPSDNQVNSRTTEEIEIIAFSVLGLYLLFNAVSDIAYHLSFYHKTKDIAGDGAILVEPYSFIIATVIEIIFALVLLFGSKYLVHFFRKIRGYE